MHECLHIQDIIELICDCISPKIELRNQAELDEDESRNYMGRIPEIGRKEGIHEYAIVQSRSSQLFALAQTCRQLQQPALQSLWNSLDSIVPLLKSAGPDLITYDVSNVKEWSPCDENLTLCPFQHLMAQLVPGEAGCYRLARPISSSDVKTMRKYASLVRHLKTQPFPLDHIPFEGYIFETEPYSPLIDSALWKALRDTFTKTVLFRNLRTISLTDATLQSTSLFATKHLTFVKMTTSLDTRNRPMSQPRIVKFCARCPNLTSFETNRLSSPEQFVETLPTASNISRLTVGPTTPEFARTLSRCSNLRHLRLTNVSGGINWPPLQAGSYFPMLETIEISTFDIRSAIQFLDTFPRITQPHAIGIFLLPKGEKLPQEHDWHDLIHSFTKYSHSLRKIRIMDDPPGLITYGVPRTNTLLSILSDNFTTLTHVEILHDGPLHFVDQNIKNLTKALPLLEVFRMFHTPREQYVDHRYGATIACLEYFAQNCPNLSTLAIAFDASKNDIPGFQQQSRQDSKLTSLDVDNSLISHNTDEVADFILHTFPNIRWLEWVQYLYCPGIKFTLMKRWSEVSKALKERRMGDNDM